ncbi:hypothetical protein A3F66_05530 [candidate division TM6 bacterium RIFCSPHIGHO2_12_FULL_32_22]|nr:MAG: hypothetical protein A3F66_05530 [candidate division TM6 bacterium RIFCSPHIGHO2_12_FULL_32_22]
MKKYLISNLILISLYASDNETVNLSEAQTIALQDIRIHFPQLYNQNPHACRAIAKRATEQSIHIFFDDDQKTTVKIKLARLFGIVRILARIEEAKLGEGKVSYNSGTAKVETKCGHVFHRSCLKAGSLTKCPLCRAAISTTKRNLKYIRHTKEPRCSICLENFDIHKTAHGKIKKKKL